MKIGLFHRVLIHDADGKLIRDSGEKEGSSWVLQFLRFLQCIMDVVDTSAPFNTNGTARIYDASAMGYSQNLSCDGDAADVDEGIVVGSGLTAEDADDYSLETRIAHGVASGELSYGACAIGNATVAAGVITLTLTRSFTNGSGADVTINEIGIYGEVVCTVGGTQWVCIARDVITPEVVSDGQVATVVYSIRTTN